MEAKPNDVHDFGDAIDPNAAHNRRTPRKYRKTALIEAVQWWQMGDHPAVTMRDDVGAALDTGEPVPFVWTLEGGHVVTPGDWIATGVHGEHWPIKPDIFAKTYEPVDYLSPMTPAPQGESDGR